MTVLVTGGAGYIGSHTVKLLLQKKYNVVIFDNLSRGHRQALPPGVPFEQVDILDGAALDAALAKYHIDAAIHFAAFAYVGESVVHPDRYYTNNVLGSYSLINALRGAGINKIVFSSTCSVYGNPASSPMSEAMPPAPINPYARTKYMVEQILQDYDTAFGITSVCLRYFNAAGDSFDLEIGESHDPEPHLIPLILFAALGKRDKVNIYGTDYPTPDGTCIRDYIHVLDLGDAHIRALEYLMAGNPSNIINLGTGAGNSVRDVITRAKNITGTDFTVTETPRRPGDPAALVADNAKARRVLGWVPQYDINDILTSAWAWHRAPKY